MTRITGRTAIAKGRTAENQLAAWLQGNGYPDAERSAAKLEDRGDIAGVPGCCVQVKHYTDPMRGLREAQDGAMRQAGGRRPIGVVRLRGVTDPADWWATTPLGWGPLPGIDHRPVPAGCRAATIWTVIGGVGAASRPDPFGTVWLITVCDRLFAALRPMREPS